MTQVLTNRRTLLTIALSLCLLASQVSCLTTHRRGATTLQDLVKDQNHHAKHQQLSKHIQAAADEAGEDEETLAQGGGGCAEGWLYSHHHCLLDTGLESGEEAELVCARYGAKEARGICIKQSPTMLSLEDATTAEEEEEEAEQETEQQRNPSASGSKTPYVCPAGWKQFEQFCLFKPGTLPKICGLLGASVIYNYCVTELPHQLPVDFMQTVKRLDGTDYDFHRETRLCCCRGGFAC